MSIILVRTMIICDTLNQKFTKPFGTVSCLTPALAFDIASRITTSSDPWLCTTVVTASHTSSVAYATLGSNTVRTIPFTLLNIG